jgi:hypothetical protein
VTTQWKRRAFVIAAILSAASHGCDETTPSSRVSVSDSSGVTVVDVGQLEGVAAPAWSVERLWRTSETGVELCRVSGARLLDHGRLAVGNGGSPEVLILDSLGVLVAAVGRAGEGPGPRWATRIGSTCISLRRPANCS